MVWEATGRAFSYVDVQFSSAEDVRQSVDLATLQRSMQASEAEIFPRKFLI